MKALKTKLAIATLLALATTAVASDYQDMGSIRGVQFSGRIASLSDGNGGHYDEALARVTNNNAYLYAKVEYRAILLCDDGTTEDHGTQSFTVSPGGTQSGESGGMWWRGCNDRIHGIRLTDASVELVDMTGYH